MTYEDQFSPGKRIKQLRESRGISLDTLANETGQARDYLARVEAGQATPPVALLLSLARALDLESGELLKADSGDEAQARRQAESRKRTDHYSYQVLTPEALNKHLKAFMVTIEPGRDLEGASYRHEGEEFHYVLKGEVTVTVGQNPNRLRAGDSLHFNSGIEHKLTNPGDAPAEVLVVLYTP